MKSVFDKKDECCGCTACKSICPTKAIEMISDEEGFLYPLINQNFCIDCGLCKKVCAFQKLNDESNRFETSAVYAAKHKDDVVRMSSTSGGAFTAISDYVFNQEGVVYGVAFDEEMNVIHQIANTKEEREKLKGSKYVQSDLKNTYVDIKKLLEDGIIVLFTGTPCQTAGLSSFLAGINTERLILCDIVCHGTPSPLMWSNHIKNLQNREGSRVVNYYCRHKVKGWHAHNEMVVFKNGKKEYKSSRSQKHKLLFYSHNILRPACHNCKYTNLIRPSDITLADFWGIEKTMLNFDDNKGISLILVNTLKGKDVFNKVKENLIYKKSNTKACLQPQLQYPSPKSERRIQFWNDYNSKGYEYIAKKYGGCNVITRVKRYISEFLIR